MTGRYLLSRAVQSVVLLVLVTAVVFLILRLTPGDPALVLLGTQAPPEAITELRRNLGLDRPLWEQYARYLGQLARGDLGSSIRAQRPVGPYVAQRIPATLHLLASAVLLATVIGIPLGIVAALRQGRAVDQLVVAVSSLGQSVPSFWFGLILIVILSVNLRLLPSSGRGTLAHLVMPAVTLAFFLVGLVLRLTRASMLEVLAADYVRTARAKGLAERLVVAKHALRNAMLPLVTVLGLQVATLLSGAIITETVFAWPGIGTLAINAIYQRDYPVVQAIVLLSALAFVLVNFLVDLLYVYLDPRIAYR